MTQYTAVDLSRLPAPDVVATLSFEELLQLYLDLLAGLDPDQYSNLPPSDPAYRLLQVAAYRELVVRADINDASRANMLAYAQDADLDHIVAREPYNVERLLIDEGDATAVPPIPPTWESNEELRRRAQLSPLRFSTAGPEGAYVFHALSADPQVLDASATSPAPGECRITVMSRQGDGTADPALLAKVEQALGSLGTDDNQVRPFTDWVTVHSVELVDYAIEADLTLYHGPDEAVVVGTAQARLNAYVERVRRLGLDVSPSGIDGALHCEGVQHVKRIHPAGQLPLSIGKHQVSRCTGITLRVVGRDE